MTTTVTASIVPSLLGYANALLYSTLAGNIHKLHCAQSSLSHVVLPHRHGSASSRHSHLHWLPVHRVTDGFNLNCSHNLHNSNTGSVFLLRNLLTVYRPSHCCVQLIGTFYLCLCTRTVLVDMCLVLPHLYCLERTTGIPTHWVPSNTVLRHT